MIDRERRYPPCSDTPKSLPSYFNTGCCRFEDGDITGIELAEGEIRLIKWAEDSEASGVTDKNRVVLGKIRLDLLFFLLDCFKKIG